MKKSLRKIICVMLSALILLPLGMTGVYAASSAEQIDYGFIEMSDSTKIEYGVYGQEDGEALLLLSPNGGDMHSFDGNVLPEMSQHYKVITVSPRGTGNSGRGNQKLTFELEAADLVTLLDTLGIDTVRIFGFSDGGNLGIVFTLNYPERVTHLSIMGANINTFGTKTFSQLGFMIEYYFLCIKAFFTKDENVITKREIIGMMVGQPNLTYDDLAAIKIPVLNIYGENDLIKRSHSVKITESIENAEGLMIIGGGHSSCFDKTDSIINPALLQFFAK